MVDGGGKLSLYRNVNAFLGNERDPRYIRWNQRMELRKYRFPNDYWVATRVKRDINSNHIPKSTDSAELSSLKYVVDALPEEFELVSQLVAVGRNYQ